MKLVGTTSEINDVKLKSLEAVIRSSLHVGCGVKNRVENKYRQAVVKIEFVCCQLENQMSQEVMLLQ